MKTIVILSLLALTSCASTTDYNCTPKGATELGSSHAENFELNRSQEYAGKCWWKNFNEESFTNTYAQAYAGALKNLCSPLAIKEAAQIAAEKSDYDHQFLGKIEKCGALNLETKELKKDYIKHFNSFYCTLEKVTQTANKDAIQLTRANQKSFNSCSNGDELQKTYSNEFQKGLLQSCSPSKLIKMAIKDARASIDSQKTIDKIQTCPDTMVDKSVAVYTRAYSREKMLILREIEVNQLNRELHARRIENSKQTFHFQGVAITSSCEIVNDRANGTFLAQNNNEKLSGEVKIRWEYYNSTNELVYSNSNKRNLYFTTWSNEESLNDWDTWHDAVACKAVIL